jgi:hypothetical protein
MVYVWLMVTRPHMVPSGVGTGLTTYLGTAPGA